VTSSAAHELIRGGARSGKSRLAEQRAADWLAASPLHDAVLLATALAADDEMAARIARHREDRAARVPALCTVEASSALPAALAAASTTHTLAVVDCLTLWLTQCLLPPPGRPAQDWPAQEQALIDALARCEGPVVLVSNEIGLGVMPLAREARAAVDAMGRLHQRVAAACARVTLMVAGCPLVVKGQA
jgi:adenosylcobinamide kinase/adenosylcobinamide-phosphate guanylyltransferase